jgi:hypothetical protein
LYVTTSNPNTNPISTPYSTIANPLLAYHNTEPSSFILINYNKHEILCLLRRDEMIIIGSDHTSSFAMTLSLLLPYSFTDLLLNKYITNQQMRREIMTAMKESRLLGMKNDSYPHSSNLPSASLYNSVTP